MISQMRLLLNMPVLNRKVNQKICEQVKNAFGGRFYEIIIGGAAFNQEVEQFLKRIDFPYTVGYGATECAPIICYADYHDFVPGSCGKPVVHMEVRIDSEDPENVPGEILARGLNVMLGYYKNEEATRQTLDKDGWYHTGDLGTMDANGNVFIKGRSKNMLLSANGQNIYPEEIEKEVCRSSAVVDSPRSGQSETVTMHRASFPAAAAFMYSAADSISVASTPIFAHCGKGLGSL